MEEKVAFGSHFLVCVALVFVFGFVGDVSEGVRLYLRRVGGGGDLSRHLRDLSGVLGLGGVQDDSVLVV